MAEALRGPAGDDEVLVVGRRGGIAEELVDRAGLRLELLDIQGLHLSSPLSLARFAMLMPRAVAQARRLIRDFHADVVVGAAGYVCVPVVIAARREGVPVVLLEQNAHPGRAVRLLARRARRVAVTYEETARRLHGAEVVVTGNPIRREFRAAAPRPVETCESLLVMGGSQGARRINRAVAPAMAGLLAAHPGLRVVHQCGRLDEAEMRSAHDSLPAELRERWELAPFFNDMASRIAAADLVLMRAGASSLAEVSALGRPMILVPYPHARGHQLHNAMPFVDAGAALLLPDEECDAERVRGILDELIAEPERLREMARRSREQARPDAADRVAQIVRESRRAA